MSLASNSYYATQNSQLSHSEWVQTQNISLILRRSYITQIFMWQTWLVFLLNKFIIIASIFWTYKLVWHILLDTWTICNSFEWNKFAAKWYSWTTQILHSGAVTNWRKMYNRQANDKIKPNYCTNPSKLVASSSETTEGAGCSQSWWQAAQRQLKALAAFSELRVLLRDLDCHLLNIHNTKVCSE